VTNPAEIGSNPN